MRQFYIFIACMSGGIAAGFCCELFFLMRFLIKPKAVRIAADAMCGIVSACILTGCYTLFRLPDIRLYMLAASALGFLLYLGSLHRILAICGKKLYNRFGSSCKRIQSRLSGLLCAKKSLKKSSSAQRLRR